MKTVARNQDVIDSYGSMEAVRKYIANNPSKHLNLFRELMEPIASPDRIEDCIHDQTAYYMMWAVLEDQARRHGFSLFKKEKR